MEDSVKRFIDKGYAAWETTDRAGNRIVCVGNNCLEIHVKSPLCTECGHPTIKVTNDEWFCPHCQLTISYEEYVKQADMRNLLESCDDYRFIEYGEMALYDDYGEFHNTSGIVACGPPELLDELEPQA